MFQLERWDEMRPRYNIAPEQTVSCVRLDATGRSRECAQLQWGLIPSWAKDSTIGRKLINARGETVAEKPSFRGAFRARRCLVLADGFFEWQRNRKKKQLFYIRLQQDRPFGFAGLWERWTNNGLELQTCTIITTEANELLRPIHDRMPVILHLEDIGEWLDPASGHGETLLAPYPANEMILYPVSDVVTRATHDMPECIVPHSAPRQRSLFE